MALSQVKNHHVIQLFLLIGYCCGIHALIGKTLIIASPTTTSPLLRTSLDPLYSKQYLRYPSILQNGPTQQHSQCRSMQNRSWIRTTRDGKLTTLFLLRGGGRVTREAAFLSYLNRTKRFSSFDENDRHCWTNSEDSEIPTLKHQKKNLTKDFFTIALPAFLQLTAEPLAGLVDTAYLGRLGPQVLGGAGVAISAHYAISKLYNDPLLRTSISLVASKDTRSSISKERIGDTAVAATFSAERMSSQPVAIAISSALLLALTIGTLQLLVYFFFSLSILQGMGVPKTSPMHSSAHSYLRIRALGTPAATLWLVTNGIFRGLGDTSTPLKYSLLFTVLNAVLDPFFIFTCNLGASGAAAGTAIAQYVALVPLVYRLNQKVGGLDVLGQWKELKGTLREYIRAGGLVFLRTVAKVSAYSVCARQAALLGSVAAATYNLTFQLGFATTQICESVAVAVQTLLAREVSGASDKSYNSASSDAIMRSARIRHLIDGSVLFGGVIAGLLSLLTFLQRENVLRGLTSDAAIQQASRVIFPAVLITQVLKGLAYPVNGILMGGLDWNFTMAAMWLANIICIGMIQFWVSNGTLSLGKIWWALAAFMGTQVVTGVTRFQSKTGVWKVLRATSMKKGELITSDSNGGKEKNLS